MTDWATHMQARKSSKSKVHVFTMIEGPHIFCWTLNRAHTVICGHRKVSDNIFENCPLSTILYQIFFLILVIVTQITIFVFVCVFIVLVKYYFFSSLLNFFELGNFLESKSGSFVSRRDRLIWTS